ncbi:MAG: cob(I)yrinic acid a,c-diamide adenosyltransferase [Halobacteriota archaeon]
MRIYTRRGDEGLTDLRGTSRVSKATPRVEAYGTVDEVNALIGTVTPTGRDELDEKLTTIQNHLHVVQAELATPTPDADDPQIRASHVEQLEVWVDDADEELEPLQSFILPGGGTVGGKLHHARAVCRRAERRAVALSSEEELNEHVVAYLNRLSDALFTFARLANKRDGVPEERPSY